MFQPKDIGVLLSNQALGEKSFPLKKAASLGGRRRRLGMSLRIVVISLSSSVCLCVLNKVLTFLSFMNGLVAGFSHFMGGKLEK